MYHRINMDFSKWIVNELEKRGWSRSEAARRGGISPSMFDKVINGQAKPGVKFVEGLAKAFKMPAEVVYRAAGILPLGTDGDALTEEILYKAKDLTDDEKGLLLEFIGALDRHRGRKTKK